MVADKLKFDRHKFHEVPLGNDPDQLTGTHHEKKASPPG